MAEGQGNWRDRVSTSLAMRFALVAGVALALVMAISGYIGAKFEERALRSQVEQENIRLTELAAASVAMSIFTGAYNEVDETVAKFQKDPSVRLVEVKDKAGKVLKTAGSAGDRALAVQTRDVVAGGQVVGTVTLGLSTEAVERAIARSWRLLLARELIGLIVLWLVLYVLIRRIVGRPLKEIAQLAAEVAGGNLTRRFAVRGRDEIAQFGSAFNDVLQRFHDIVAQVRTSAESVASGAGQISDGNINLSQRTEQQATSLEQTAATMEEFSSTTAQNADAAIKANEVAQTAVQNATRGGTVVNEVVATMSEISASSGKIADIVSVIDSIAFQTNILALNAAVEAARAGEQGRGFAVVAAEVRALAQRSAGAAKEIRALIAESVQKVDGGAKVAQAAGSTIADLVGSVQKVSTMMETIANASREQSVSVRQVSETVTHMDTSVQQNAAVVEQATAATASLKHQADDLLAIVAGFQVSRAAATPAVTVAPAPAPGAFRASARPRLPLAEAPRQPGLHAKPNTSDGEWREF